MNRSVHQPSGDQPAHRHTITFIMSVYNGIDYTRACLESLRGTVDISRHEVIIVDDTSSDGTREFLAALPPPFRIIFNDQKRSFAANNNTAARLATGDLLCLINNDLLLTDGWLGPMLDAFEALPAAGIVGNVQRNPRTGKYDHMGIVFAGDGMAKNFGKHFHVRLFKGPRQWRAVTAACCLISKRVFLEAQGFDEAFINGFEDVDLCLRLGQSGYKHYVVNESVVYHYVSSSPTRRDHLPANKRRFLDRWQGPLRASFTWRDRALFATNYVYSLASQPWFGKKPSGSPPVPVPATASQPPLPQADAQSSLTHQ
jgi:GT2 family glycosyltransferase